MKVWANTSKWLLFFGLILVNFQNCSSGQNNSLFEGNTNIDSVVDANSTYMLSPKPLTIAVEADQDMIVVGGECAVGESLNHYIEFQLFAKEGNPSYAPNQALRVRDDSACRVSTPGAQCYKFTGAKCEQGRFYAHIPIGAEIPGNTYGIPYRLTGTLVLVDASGAEKRDAYYPQSVEVQIYGQ